MEATNISSIALLVPSRHDGHLWAPSRRGGAHTPATLYQPVNGEREVHPPFFRYGDERSRSGYRSYISTATRAFDMTHRPLLFDSPLLPTGPDPLINPSLLFLFPPGRSKLHFSSRHCSPKPVHACLEWWEPIAPRWVSALRPTHFRSCLASLLRAFTFPFSFPVSLTFTLTLSKLRCYPCSTRSTDGV